MTPTSEQLAAVTEPIRERYLASVGGPDEEKWARAVAHHAGALEGAEPPLPSVFRMAGELVTTGIRVAMSGMEMAPEDLQAKRWETCLACVDHFRPSDNRCGAADGCGCDLTEKVKFAAAACPIGKW